MDDCSERAALACCDNFEPSLPVRGKLDVQNVAAVSLCHAGEYIPGKAVVKYFFIEVKNCLETSAGRVYSEDAARQLLGSFAVAVAKT